MGRYCQECNLPSITHFFQWIKDLLIFILPSKFLSFVPNIISQGVQDLIIKLLVFLKIIKKKKNFQLNFLPLRTAIFMNEARKKGLEFEAFFGPFGYINYFRTKFKKKNILFNGLPGPDLFSTWKSQIIDDKYLVKKWLQEENFPVVEGKAFWFFQKREAEKYGFQLGFPLVVKPRSGSLSLHLTTDIQDLERLKLAIDWATSYSPVFIIERFLSHTFTYRATVVNFDFVACCQQIPAHVIGDGFHTIAELVKIKNSDPKRRNLYQKGTILCKLVINHVTKNLLEEKNYSLFSIPKKGEVVYLQKDSFLKLGGDIVEVTSQVHPDNFQLFCQVAKFFETPLVGIDFLAQNISLSFKQQPSAILELNSLPCIEMHHFPSFGKPQNVAKEILKIVFNCY